MQDVDSHASLIGLRSARSHIVSITRDGALSAFFSFARFRTACAASWHCASYLESATGRFGYRVLRSSRISVCVSQYKKLLHGDELLIKTDRLFGLRMFFW